MNVLLTALSAKHIHKTLAPWCLKAYCDVHVPACQVFVQEHTINDHVNAIAAELFEARPDVVGFSCYIWNIEHVSKAAALLKKCLPACVIVLGGPEVSFETDESAYPFADYIVQGPGEAAFANLLKDMLGGSRPEGKLLPARDGADLNQLPTPHTAEYFRSFQEGQMGSIANQLVYYESARGCPFSCTYCLSSTDCGVKELPLDRVFSEIRALLHQGAGCIKFVDRTFNANKNRALKILGYILSLDTECTFHFEVAADLFDPELLQLISAMPAQRVQFEIGIQSFNPATLAQINRSMDRERVLQNIQTLMSFGNCHVHVDLIAGLPFDTLESFANSINTCIGLGPHMLQLGFLKLLKGTKIRADRREYGYIYNEFPPYEVVQSSSMGFEEIIRLKGIERVLNRFYNSGIFAHSVQYAMNQVFQSPYAFFDVLSAFCKGKNLKVSPKNAYTMLFQFLCKHMDRPLAEHYIKLDVFTCNAKNVLPDGIAAYRNKEAERDFKRSITPPYQNVRVEYFDYDKQTRAFIYDEKNKISQAYKVIVLEKS